MTALEIPSSVSILGANALGNCSRLTSVTLQPGLINIGKGAFSGCKALPQIAIPSSVTGIGENAFSQCDSLNSISVNPGNANYSSLNTVLYNKMRTLLIRCPARFSGDHATPSGVTAIGDFAFSGCKELEGVMIPFGVATIGKNAFSGCSRLKGVMLPGSLVSIGDDAFYGCIEFKTMMIPVNVTHIGDYAFTACDGLESVSILSNAPSFGWLAFRDCMKLRRMEFAGNAPTVDTGLAKTTLPLLKVYYFNGKTGFTSPTWFGYPTVNMGAGTPLKTWLIAGGFPYDSNLQSDSNGDGVNLLMAYALNLDPNQNLGGSMPKPALTAGEMSLRFFAGAAGVSYVVEATDDMVHWSKDGVTISGPNANQIRTATVDRSGPNRFMRLAVSN